MIVPRPLAFCCFPPLLVRAALAVVIACLAAAAQTCPFCTAVKPTFSQQRESAAVVALAEAAEPSDSKTVCQVHQVLKGADRLNDRKTLTLALDGGTKRGALVLLFGEGSAETPVEQLAWTAVAVDETSYAYFARAPSLRTATAERLRYFAPFLEHADPVIAEDAYREFGHAPFDEVAAVADRLPMDKLRGWLADARVLPEHKGFYGLALGLARSADERRANADFLRMQIEKPDNDFRAGFDGVLGGYLMVAGEAGLNLIDERYLANPFAAEGDVRHAVTAMRFYHEYGREIPADRLRQALRHVLARPEFAERAITDLARMQDWRAPGRIAALYWQPAYAEPGTRRAIVGYLLACPAPEAADELKQLRAADSKGVAQAEQELMSLGGAAPK